MIRGRGTSAQAADADLSLELGTPGEPFEEFYRREFPRMVSLACAVSGSRVAAEDIAQEALLEASRRWASISGYDKPGAWVRRVTIQLASKRRRRQLVEAAALRRLPPVRVIPEGPEDVETVLAAIRTLPARQRAVVVLCYLEDLPVAEVADILGMAEGTAKSHLHRARRTLARLLGEEQPG